MLLAVRVASAQVTQDEGPLRESLPTWSRKVLEAPAFAGKYALDSRLNPYFQQGDFDADGPGKAEAEVAAIERARSEGRLFCDQWGQASHGGELTGAVAAGYVRREDVTELGAVCAGLAQGRGGDQEITLFDSTGLAIQDLAIALGALESLRAGAIKPQTFSL
jgi:alanine dehydrogenase